MEWLNGQPAALLALAALAALVLILLSRRAR